MASMITRPAKTSTHSCCFTLASIIKKNLENLVPSSMHNRPRASEAAVKRSTHPLASQSITNQSTDKSDKER
eukprot:8073672-Lingulodinium_polyedra.AAC.1